MHPDLFLRVYQQQERELEHLLRHRRAARNRAPAAGSRGGFTLRMPGARPNRRTQG